MMSFCSPAQRPNVSCATTALSCIPGQALLPSMFGCAPVPAAGGGGSDMRLVLGDQWGSPLASGGLCPAIANAVVTLRVSTTPNAFGCRSSSLRVTATPRAAASLSGIVAINDSGECEADRKALRPLTSQGYRMSYAVDTPPGPDYTQLTFDTDAGDIQVNVPMAPSFQGSYNYTWGTFSSCNYQGVVYVTVGDGPFTLTFPVGITAVSLVVDRFYECGTDGSFNIVGSASDGFNSVPMIQTISASPPHDCGPGPFNGGQQQFGFYARGGYIQSITVSPSQVSEYNGLAFAQLAVSTTPL